MQETDEDSKDASFNWESYQRFFTHITLTIFPITLVLIMELVHESKYWMKNIREVKIEAKQNTIYHEHYQNRPVITRPGNTSKLNVRRRRLEAIETARHQKLN